MSASYIQVAPDSTGKKLQTFENTISANVVEAEAVTLVNSSGAEITALPVTDNSGSLTVDNGGTFAVQAAATLAAETTKVIGTVNVAAGQTIAATNAGTFAVQATANEVPDATATYAPTNATSSAYEASRVIKASAGVLFCVNGYNSKTSAQFIQLHNAASLPSEAAAPVVVF